MEEVVEEVELAVVEEVVEEVELAVVEEVELLDVAVVLPVALS